MAEAREERLAHNEVVFRSLNEAIDQIAIGLGGPAPYEFVCECATSGCFERIELNLPDYEAVRAEGSRFILCPGHEDTEVEQVVETHRNYVVVQKAGVAGLVALEADPRT